MHPNRGQRQQTTTRKGSSNYMEHETLYTASKWDILKKLEDGPASPLELSKVSGTTIANISQQLRLLEMAGLVTSKRVSNRAKGKPRVLYSLAGNLSYLIATTGDFVEKKALQLSEYNKIIMRIWFYDQPALHYTLEKAFWQIEEHLDKITFLAIETTNDTITFYVQGKEFKPFTITDPTGKQRKILFKKTRPKDAYILYTKESGDRK